MDEYIRGTTNKLIGLLTDAGLSNNLAKLTGEFSMLILLIIISYLAYLITWKVMRKIIIPFTKRSKTQFDDLLIKHRFFRKVSYLIPALLLYYFTDDTTTIPILISALRLALEVFFVLNAVLIINSILSTINDYYDRYDFAKDNPIKGGIQVLKIISYIIGLMVAIGMLIDRDISSLFLSLGALSAVLLLIFKDPILGFVGGLQLTFNKMVSIGDWIAMPKFGADGTVLDITLTTVKVQNWDKTIINIPTYALVSDSFQNWRGMEESGGRRIKRSIFIDMDSIKFCTDEMLEKYKKIGVLRPYIEKTEKELKEYNEKHNIESSSIVNGRRQTNIGVFRAYLREYLHNRPDIHQDMTFLVRQLQPNEKGLPIEIYVFTKTIAWAKYEGIQSDIFDHVLASVPEFNLKVYQYPNSGDIRDLIGSGRLSN